MTKAIEVVAGIVTDSTGRTLVQQRPKDKAQAGRWEFPGGKIERDESHLQTLQREMREEVSIQIVAAHTCLTLSHQYPHALVNLTVMQVTEWCGDAIALEGQHIAWVTPAELPSLDLLEANDPIVRYIITAGVTSGT